MRPYSGHTEFSATIRGKSSVPLRMNETTVDWRALPVAWNAEFSANSSTMAGSARMRRRKNAAPNATDSASATNDATSCSAESSYRTSTQAAAASAILKTNRIVAFMRARSPEREQYATSGTTPLVKPMISWNGTSSNFCTTPMPLSAATGAVDKSATKTPFDSEASAMTAAAGKPTANTSRTSSLLKRHQRIKMGTCRQSRLRMAYTARNAALIALENAVASAAPATPKPNPNMKRGSNAMQRATPRHMPALATPALPWACSMDASTSPVTVGSAPSAPANARNACACGITASEVPSKRKSHPLPASKIAPTTRESAAARQTEEAATRRARLTSRAPRLRDTRLPPPTPNRFETAFNSM